MFTGVHYESFKFTPQFFMWVNTYSVSSEANYPGNGWRHLKSSNFDLCFTLHGLLYKMIDLQLRVGWSSLSAVHAVFKYHHNALLAFQVRKSMCTERERAEFYLLHISFILFLLRYIYMYIVPIEIYTCILFDLSFISQWSYKNRMRADSVHFTLIFVGAIDKYSV